MNEPSQHFLRHMALGAYLYLFMFGGSITVRRMRDGKLSTPKGWTIIALLAVIGIGGSWLFWSW